MNRFHTRSKLLAAVVATALGIVVWQLGPWSPVQAAPAVDEGLAPAVEPASFADVIAAVSPAVVNISTSGRLPGAEAHPGPGPTPDFSFPRSPRFEEFFRRFFEPGSAPGEPRRMPGVRSMGSGFIVAPDGVVVTNHHVINGADEIVVTLGDGTRYDAEVLGSDPKTDLAVLDIEGEELPYVRFGDSDGTRAGDWVIAIGNPFGRGGSATTGIVSARGRDLRSGPYDDYLQI
ncbi:MAG: trypsin-like peptidase domain-containing protein, partial [Thermoanaerobaculia bacterium]|nr:trypsin-like peptidase domain-containing protein [Thermoanaerobaculia bacterium]